MYDTSNFSKSERIKSPEWLGLIYWGTSDRKLKLQSIQHDWIDGWDPGQNGKIFIADLDGDGLSEVYIANAEWTGVLKWQENRFQVLWMIHHFIPHINHNGENKWQLSNKDKSCPDKFSISKDGIVHGKSSLSF